MEQKPRRAPRNVPDSLPKRDEGTDVVPDNARTTERSAEEETPDSLPSREIEDTGR
jgi:hypothetical protein